MQRLYFGSGKDCKKTGEEKSEAPRKRGEKNQKIQLRALEREEAAREKEEKLQVKRQKRKPESRSAGKKDRRGLLV